MHACMHDDVRHGATTVEPQAGCTHVLTGEGMGCSCMRLHAGCHSWRRGCGVCGLCMHVWSGVWGHEWGQAAAAGRVHDVVRIGDEAVHA